MPSSIIVWRSRSIDKFFCFCRLPKISTRIQLIENHAAASAGILWLHIVLCYVASCGCIVLCYVASCGCIVLCYIASCGCIALCYIASCGCIVLCYVASCGCIALCYVAEASAGILLRFVRGKVAAAAAAAAEAD